MNGHGGSDLVILRHHVRRQGSAHFIPDRSNDFFFVPDTLLKNKVGRQRFIPAILNIHDLALADGFVFQDISFNIEQKNDLPIFSAEMIGSPAKDKDLANYCDN